MRTLLGWGSKAPLDGLVVFKKNLSILGES